MKKILSVLLSVLMLLTIGVVNVSANEEPVGGTGSQPVTTYVARTGFGDGDYYTTLQAAIDAVPTGSHDTVTIELLDNITLNSTVVINKSNVVIDGKNYTISANNDYDDWKQYKVDGANSKFGKIDLISVTGDEVVVKNLKIDIKDYRGMSCITTKGGSNITYENIVMNGRGCGHYYGYSNSGTITFKGCDINTHGYGIHCAKEGQSAVDFNVVIEDCEVNGWDSFGDLSYLYVKNSIFYGAYDTGKNGLLAKFRPYCNTVIEDSRFGVQFIADGTDATQYCGIDSGAECLVSFVNCSVLENDGIPSIHKIYELINYNDNDANKNSIFAIDSTGNVDGYTGGTFVTKNGNIQFPQGYKLKNLSEHVYTISGPVAKIGNTYYPTLNDAVDNVQNEETIVLLQDIDDACGVKVNGNKNFTIDFDSHMFKVTKEPLEGSTGTKNQCFQLLDGSTIVMKNGTIIAGIEGIKFLVQNYCNLTLTDMNLDSGNISTVQYLLSNNSGKVKINGNTNLYGKGIFALDCSWWPTSYSAGTQVTVDTTGEVVGDIEIGAYGNGSSISTPNLSNIKINNIKFDGEIKTSAVSSGQYGTGLDEDGNNELLSHMLVVNGGIFSKPLDQRYIKTGYVCVANTDKNTNVRYPYTIAEKSQEIGVDTKGKQNENKDVDHAMISGVGEQVVNAVAQEVKKTNIDLKAEALALANNPSVINAQVVQTIENALGPSSFAENIEQVEININVALKQTLTDVKPSTTVPTQLKSFKVDITPVYNIVAVNKTDSTKNLIVATDKVIHVNRTMLIKVYLPNDFASTTGTRVYVKHLGNVYGDENDTLNPNGIFTEQDTDGIFIEFFNPDGFSEFEFSLDKLVPDSRPDSGRRYNVPNTGVR